MQDTKLLVRIDERVKKMTSDISGIKDCLDRTVENNDEYREMKGKVDRLWDDRNKLIGWMLGAGMVGGATGSIFKGLVGAILAK